MHERENKTQKKSTMKKRVRWHFLTFGEDPHITDLKRTKTCNYEVIFLRQKYVRIMNFPVVGGPKIINNRFSSLVVDRTRTRRNTS